MVVTSTAQKAASGQRRRTARGTAVSAARASSHSGIAAAVGALWALMTAPGGRGTAGGRGDCGPLDTTILSATKTVAFRAAFTVAADTNTARITSAAQAQRVGGCGPPGPPRPPARRPRRPVR